jgi:hypothetical protein
MASFLLQNWTTVRAVGPTVLSIAQGVEGWVDLQDGVDLTAWVDAREVTLPGTAVVSLVLETSPSRDEASFQPIAPPIALSAAATPLVIRSVLSSSTVPLGRWLRWRLSVPSGSTGTWDATFRIAITTTPFSYFLPTQLSGCSLWLRADLGITIATGVSAWNDQSGVGDAARNATQATGASQPAFQAKNSAFNNQPTVNFSGSQLMPTGTWSAAQAQPQTVFIVAKDTSGASNKYFVDSIAGASPFAVLSVAGVTNLNAGTTRSASFTDTVSFAGVAVMNGATSLWYPSARTATSIVAGTIGANGFTGITIGNAAAGGANAGASIAEIAYWNRVLAANEVSRLLSYAGGRYGITIGN